MKKVIRIFCILSLVTLALVGCSGSDEGAAKKVAEELIRNIYTVDAKKVAELKLLYGQAAPGSDIIGEGVPKGSTTPSNAEYTKTMQSLNKNIEPLMTKGGYEAIIANQFNTAIARICADGNYTTQVTDLTLGENVYKDNEDKNTVRYYYETKSKFITTDGKSEKIDTSKGVIELIKENSKWKVQELSINQLPKLDK
ncbi:hypothetical protein [Clostridium lacusfryxellense]|uniref:hypothetical protein n=1 Tax=Clostridium lacusfryxellense TaxID=205328 RepID=UPI001C0DD52C|nr:hypothetical protein [Clostridium lacusfryxellense]MBU3113662.1 hypothetical protein [Clostridium lacusfryxellense]